MGWCMTSPVLFLSALALPLAVIAWQLGRLGEQRAFLAYRREKYREQAAAATKAAEELRLELMARIASLTASTHGRLTTLDTRVSHLEQGRIPQKRAA